MGGDGCDWERFGVVGGGGVGEANKRVACVKRSQGRIKMVLAVLSTFYSSILAT